ncbi:TnsD family Tn7-like transposition protein [Paenibacillus pseudetheri]|uniref:Transposon Tn7 transposition protein TnsD C-termianl domain-containing protein n=1 Tax=Paenibacillus pseudetheri TaxID=2897682 RepID=A0ABM9BGQ8_9BACL|nr:TnsD family Tn7-like transposition protein [Paenibacillus pseudetheri]CAH1057605.1 hypothetical protein PAECIP111894_03763 [Paenibacillus pseudetheri]
MEYSYFPELYPDELLYSACARYQMNIGKPAQKLYIEKLFDVRSCCAITDFPSHLSSFVAKIAQSHNTVETILNNHTNYPYYRPFISKETAQKVRHYMLSPNNGRRIHMSLGITACSIPKPKFLKYCNNCVLHDLGTYGVSYWRRVHQLPGVYLCPLHSSVLNNSNILISTIRGKHDFIDFNTVYKATDAEVKIEFENEMSDIAKSSLDILNLKCEDKICKETLREYYLADLDSKGYVTGNGRLRFKMLIADFTEFHSSSFLRTLKSNIEEDSEDTWLHKLLRKSKENCHPLRHILFTKFLGVSFNDLTLTRRPESFGYAPWPCLNKTSTHYKESVVQNCVITTGSKTKKPTGHFICDCGFIYVRTGPDLSYADRFRIGRIQSFGPIWLQAAQELHSNHNLSQREKAKRLGVDSKTFVRMIKKGEKQKYTKVQKKVTGSRSGKEHQKKSPARVNWQERDQAMSVKVFAAVTKILDEAKPTRITKSEIVKRGQLHSSIIYYPSKLPDTKLVLSQVIESLEEFQMRRIDWALKQLKDCNELKKWKVLKLAAITSKCTEQVRNYLDRRLE